MKQFSKVFYNEKIEEKAKEEITVSKVMKYEDRDIQIGYECKEYKVIIDGMILLHNAGMYSDNPFNLEFEDLMGLLMFNDIKLEPESFIKEIKLSLAERFNIKMIETAMTMEASLRENFGLW